MSIVQRGLGFPAFLPVVYDYMTTGKYNAKKFEMMMSQTLKFKRILIYFFNSEVANEILPRLKDILEASWQMQSNEFLE